MDKVGIYVVQLVVSDGLELSEPKFLVISSTSVLEESIIFTQDYATPLSCSLSEGFIGCVEESTTLLAPPGEYVLSVTNNSAERISLSLNSETISFPDLRLGNEKILVPVSLLTEENIIKINIAGPMVARSVYRLLIKGI